MTVDDVTHAGVEALLTLARWTAVGTVLLEKLGEAEARHRWQSITEGHALDLIQAIREGSELPETMPYSRVLLEALDSRFAEEDRRVP